MTAFRVFKQYEQTSLDLAARRTPLRPLHAEYFSGDGMPARFARALCEEKATSLKELLEAFEFFQAVRKHVTRPQVVDICSGHGLVGVLFALFERKVDQVVLLDQHRPVCFDRIVVAADHVAPWVREKLVFREVRLESAGDLVAAGELLPGSGLVAVHACGMRTDRVLQLAIELESPVACLPCCRPHRHHPAPDVLKRELGGDLAIDVHRTYELERAGYRVRWKAIPERITPMNRILIGCR